MPPSISLFFFSNDPPTPDIYTLSLHDALPILDHQGPVEALLLLVVGCGCEVRLQPRGAVRAEAVGVDVSDVELPQSEDHRVEDDGHDRGDGRREHAGGNADGEGEEDVDRVLRVLERVAE